MILTTTLRTHTTSGLLADGTGGQQLQQGQGQRQQLQLLQQGQNKEKQQQQQEEESAATPPASRDELVSL